MYVDDCFVIGNKQAIKKALDDIEVHFDIKQSEEISDFIGCTIERKDNRVLLSQPDLINKLIKTFESKISKMRLYETPATGGGRVQRPMTKEELISDEDQSEFRSRVGSLLYLLKHSRPDLSNSVHELTKVMDGANKAHQKMLCRVIKHVQDTKNRN